MQCWLCPIRERDFYVRLCTWRGCVDRMLVKIWTVQIFVDSVVWCTLLFIAFDYQKMVKLFSFWNVENPMGSCADQWCRAQSHEFQTTCDIVLGVSTVRLPKEQRYSCSEPNILCTWQLPKRYNWHCKHITIPFPKQYDTPKTMSHSLKFTTLRSASLISTWTHWILYIPNSK